MWCLLCARRGHRVKPSRTPPGRRSAPPISASVTLVVLDVDLLSPEVVRVHHANDPDHPTIYRRGDIAEAEPAVPGWRMPVGDLFA